MHTFQDSNGRVWAVNINVGTLKRVRALCGVDLYNILSFEGKDTGLLEQLANDPILLVDVIYAVCKDEADRLGITAEAFGESMAGDAIVNATNALLDDLVDFFPAAKRMVLNRIMNATRRYQMAAEKQLMRQVENGMVEETLEKVLTDVYGTATATEE